LGIGAEWKSGGLWGVGYGSGTVAEYGSVPVAVR